MSINNKKRIHVHNKKSKRLNKNIGGEIKKCDRAYKNALGTCWAVAAQTVFTFGDLTYTDLEKVMTSFNLDTKNQFINHRIEEVKQLTQLNSLFINYILNDEKIVYIKNVLNKFIDRYYSKVLEKQNTEKPKAIDPTLNPQRCELVISQNFKKIFDYPILKKTYNETLNHGGNIFSKYLFINLLSLFFLSCKVSFKNYYDDFDLLRFNIKKDLGILLCTENHVCCLYICNGVQKYYNNLDNQVYDCNWINLLKESEEKNLYIENGECLRAIDIEEYTGNKQKLQKVLYITLLSKSRELSNLDNEINDMLEFKNLENISDKWVNKLLSVYMINHYKDIGIFKALSNGDTFAQFYSAKMHETGEIIKQDIVKAVKLYKLAADKGHAESQYRLAKYSSDYSNHYLILAAEQGNVNAQILLGRRYSGTQYKSEAFRLLSLAAEKGNGESLLDLAYMYKYGLGVNRNDDKAVHLIFNAVKQGYISALKSLIEFAEKNGNANAQISLGELYSNSEIIPYDRIKAFYYFSLAAAQGNAEAQFKLANYLSRGSTDSIFEKNEKNDLIYKDEIMRLYTLAAAQGHAGAQNNLGLIFQNGFHDVEEDFEEALRLYRLSAAQGTEHAQYNLAEMFESGEGVEQDYLEAVRLYTLAAEKGHMISQLKLANMYEKGIGVYSNLSEALKWYRLAAANDSVFAQIKLWELELKITQNLGILFEHSPEIVSSSPQNIIEAEPEVKVEAEPEVKVEAEPEVKVEAEPEVKVEAEPEVKVEAEPYKTLQPSRIRKPRHSGQSIGVREHNRPKD